MTTAIDSLFRAMCAAGASDLHLSSEMPPLIRNDGSMAPLDESAAPLTPDAIELCKKIGGGRVAALEVLMQVGKAAGMVTLNDALLDLVNKTLVAPEEAYLKAVDKAGFEAQLKRSNIARKPASTTP